MANKWLPSEDITVFPTTRRLVKQQDARLMTEKSLVGIINQLVDKDAFIITPKSALDADSPFEFNIHGYYFCVEKLDDITSLFNEESPLEIYASITLDTGNGYTELLGQDDTLGDADADSASVYRGVSFSSEQPSDGSNTYYLKILERATTSDSWSCPELSFYKFVSNSLDFQIDGGIIS